MKDQYTADAGDYGKYGLLRFLMDQGVRVGVNWYLTPDDFPKDSLENESGALAVKSADNRSSAKNIKQKDGKHVKYLETGRDRACDPILFEQLQKLVMEDRRTTEQVEKLDFFQNTPFFREIVPKDKDGRKAWHQNSLAALQHCDLVFLDPDNGASFSSRLKSHKDKYAFYEEILDYYNQGSNVVYYCQRGRRKQADWLDKMQELSNHIDGSCLALTFHRGTQRAYIFLVHPQDREMYQTLFSDFEKTMWMHGRRPCFLRPDLPSKN